ncbi:non-ribosomal peptide synthetase [Williamsia sp. CHRR-6]|uniref:non-ribosomal peptide synthetase n=1 Tax=Williamsia sp. CHRR-6 TaxID=2835871 RepID=UPI001BD9354E|nr:non-ribosomal peptide synthetase [Williamsia sp. CHRR-6]MBT0565850.1 amino acid adenylation domain-containing protein [Williamsia sp. CHRR-6]
MAESTDTTIQGPIPQDTTAMRRLLDTITTAVGSSDHPNPSNLGRTPPSPADLAELTLGELGLDSMAALRLRALLIETFGVEPALTDLLGHLTLREVADTLASSPRPSAPIRPENRGSGDCPAAPVPTLTPVQQAYWAGRQDGMGDGGLASWWYMEYRRTAPGDPLAEIERLRRAFAVVVGRHPMLRLTITRDGQPRISDSMPVAVEVIDLRTQPPAEVGATTTRTREEWSHRRCCTETGPLFDLRAVVESTDTIRFCVGFDVLAIDFTSWQLIHRDWEKAYRQPTAAWPASQLSFFDAVARAHEPHRRIRAQRYWSRRVPTLPGTPRPAAIAAPPTTTTRRRFARVQHRLDAATWSALIGQARAHGVSRTALIAAAFGLLLDRWGARERFCLNVTLLDRPLDLDGADELVGDFTTTALLAMPEQPTGRTFAEIATLVNHELWEAIDHREYCGVEVARDCAVAQGDPLSPTHTVVLTSGIGLGRDGSADGTRCLGPDSDRSPGPVGGWLGEEIYGVSQTPQVHLDHLVWEESGELRLIFDHAVDHFDTAAVTAMMQAYRRLLVRLATDPRTWDDATVGWDPCFATPQTLPHPLPAILDDSDGLLDGPVRRAAQVHADRTALITPAGRRSHRQLAELAAGAACQLRYHGVHPGDLVGVALTKSIEQIIAVRAILAIGAAYVPIDPAWPAERISRVCHRADITHMVIDDLGTDGSSVPDAVTAIPASELADVGASARPDIDSPAADPTELAYVIFTSGSTGEPKGVAIEHRQARVTLDDVVTRFGIRPQDRVLGLAALTFDLSVFDVFGLPGSGGALVLPDPDRARDPQHWLDLIATEQVTVWNTAPAVLEMLMEYCTLVPGAARLLRSLRLVMLSGDWIPVTLPDRIRAVLPHIEFHSLGGATEAAIWSISHRVDRVDPDAPSIPYGRALSRQRFFVLDDAQAPCAMGETGELFIGGDGVARGYVGAPDLTAQRFAMHPAIGQRLYRTGDLGQWCTDGTIRFLGRNDRQVKIRGHRIELDEIESVLTRHPAVRRAIVAVTGATSSQSIVAYCCPTTPVSAAELRAHIAAHVPEYMVPSMIRRVANIPLTANGKVDLTALANAPEWESLVTDIAEQPDVASDHPAAQLCSEIGFGNIVIGGDTLVTQGLSSVDLVRLANRIEDTTGIRPSLSQLATGWEWLDSVKDTDSVTTSFAHHPIPSEEPTTPPLVYAATMVGVRLPEAVPAMHASAFLRSAAAWIDANVTPHSRLRLCPDPDTLVVIDHPVGGTASPSVATAAASDGSPCAVPAVGASTERQTDTFALTEMQLAYLVGRADREWGPPVAPHYYTEIEVDGPDLDLDRLAAAFTTVQRHHPMLRARATADARQRIDAEPRAHLVVATDPGAAQSLRRSMSHRVANPMTDPLITLAASIDGDRARVHVSLDLLFCDAHSAVIIARDLATAYAGQPLQAPQRHFREWIGDIALAADTRSRRQNLAFWRDSIDSLRPGPRLAIGTRRARTPEVTRRRWCSTPQQLQSMTAAARTAGVSLDALVLACLGAATAEFGADGNTLVVTMFGRPEAHAGVVGDYTQTMLIEPRPDRSATEAEYLRAVAGDLLAGCDHSTGAAGVHANEVMRMARDRFPATAETRFPVVYSSGIGTTDEVDASMLLEGFAGGRTVHAISQTPQVLLDTQAFVAAGTLRLNVDARSDLLDSAVLNRLWNTLIQHIERYAGDAGSVPEDSAEMVDRAAAPTTPTTSVHRRRAAIVDLLARRHPTVTPPVSAHHTFFEVGETSLSLVEMLAELSEVTGSDVGVLDLFAFPTADALAAELDRRNPAHGAVDHAAAQPQLSAHSPASTPPTLDDPIAAARSRGARRRALIEERP